MLGIKKAMPFKEPKLNKSQTRLLLTAPPATKDSYKAAMSKASTSHPSAEDINYGLALCEALTAAQSYTTNKSWLSPPKPTSLSDSQLKQLAKDFPNKSNNLKNDAIFISKIHHALRYPEYAQKTLASCNTPTESQLDLARCIIQFKRLPELLNVSSLSQLKGKIKVLQALSSHSQWPKDTPSFWALCYQWLVMILEHLKKYFYSHPQLWLENFSDCQMLAQEIFTLTQTIPLQKEQWQPLIDWLEHAYTQYDQPLASAQLTIASQSTFEKMKHWCTSPYFPSFSYKLITYTYKSSHQIWLTKLDKIEKTLMQDVDCLQRWGQLRYQHALAVWASQGMVSIEPYLTAYTEVSERIQALSAQAWAFREDSSKLLREKEQEDAPYLDKLNALDEILLKVHQRMQTLSKDWLETNAKFCPDDTLIPKVNELLAYLDSNAAQTMQGLNWINHTCYSQLAEKALAPEMNARSRHQSEPYWGKLGISRRYYDKEFLSNEYHLETVYTLTDFILMKLGSERQTLKRLLLSLHPDKLSQNSENAVKEVATFCFNSITRLRKDIETVTSNWATGQWAAVGPDSISPFKQPYNYELSDIVSPNEPTQNLNLGALTWHQEYIAWLAQQAEVGASLQKNTQQVRRVKTFFNRANGEDFDIMARVFFADTQQHEVKHRGRSYAQIKQIRDDAKAEAQQAEARAQQAEARAQQAQARAQQAQADLQQLKADLQQLKADLQQQDERSYKKLNRMVNGELCERWTSEFIQQLQTSLNPVAFFETALIKEVTRLHRYNGTFSQQYILHKALEILLMKSTPKLHHYLGGETISVLLPASDYQCLSYFIQQYQAAIAPPRINPKEYKLFLDAAHSFWSKNSTQVAHCQALNVSEENDQPLSLTK